MGFFTRPNRRTNRRMYREIPLCFAQPGWFNPVVFEEIITFHPNGDVMICDIMFPPQAPIDLCFEENHAFRAFGSDHLTITAKDGSTVEFRCVTPSRWLGGRPGWFRLVPIASTACG